MGVGEGVNELPDHLLQNLRKRAVYYRPERPKEIPVRFITIIIEKLGTLIHIRHVDILCITEACAQEEILLHVPFTGKLFLVMSWADH